MHLLRANRMTRGFWADLALLAVLLAGFGELGTSAQQ